MTNIIFEKKPIKYRLQTIAPATLQQWREQNQVILIDVREAGEYAGEHIQGAISIPLSRFESEKIPQDIHQQLVLYCQSSNRSAQAAQKLLLAGYGSVNHLKGGLNNWKEKGYETKINANGPISLIRQVQIVAGSLVLIGTIFGAFVSPWFLLLSGFVGAGLTFAGITNTCALAMLLAKLPYNQLS